jgi:hypothetical protein
MEDNQTIEAVPFSEEEYKKIVPFLFNIQGKQIFPIIIRRMLVTSVLGFRSEENEKPAEPSKKCGCNPECIV